MVSVTTKEFVIMDSACVYLDILVLNANVSSTTFQILAAAYNYENTVIKIHNFSNFLYL